MKQFLIIFALLSALSLNAQNSENDRVKATIEQFFEAFHQQDTTALKAFANGNIKMQSISVNKDGETVLSETDYFQFIQNISSIPKDRTFEEKIFDLSIKVDGHMAHAWVPYEFWYQDKLSHCGVNSFQLIKEENSWKIMYLVDSRRRDNCP